ncbi:hypothetical protein HGO34_24020 [Agrobacterium vitis]|uniref:CdiI immunity protein domain-containing protein n=2 Tax=Agrobacterium vitis TaxID=373 RepID=A0AAE5AY89_AGRVI|nr:hypothetical protein [Allorhizobium sp. Av2]MCM2442773.1 hypothetical protein [Agrobacterium vitis]MUZ60474.1 hypothetical protein [Agrobacterium vitis]MVA68495.1 hypothetical protein [Agrobacterium vitis]MVA88939.1 hypothetical protein [Agrobacterium vitis]
MTMPTMTDDFDALSGLIGSYLHQDMDLEYQSVPAAIAGYARLTEDTRKQQLVQEMHEFLRRYHNDIEGEFSKRYWFDFSPQTLGQTVPEFFDMVRDILTDPDSYHRFLPTN